MTNKNDKTGWSKWIDMMRMDTECTFGKLKGRWRILESGVRLSSVVNVDKVWFTCCALQNWLLEIDGYTCYAWAGGTFFPVVLLCQCLLWREIGFGLTYYLYT